MQTMMEPRELTVGDRRGVASDAIDRDPASRSLFRMELSDRCGKARRRARSRPDEAVARETPPWRHDAELVSTTVTSLLQDDSSYPSGRSYGFILIPSFARVSLNTTAIASMTFWP